MVWGEIVEDGNALVGVCLFAGEDLASVPCGGLFAAP
jgi:hypothetical protein